MERDMKKMSIGGHFKIWDREECYINVSPSIS